MSLRLVPMLLRGAQAVAGVNKLHLARTVGGLILAEHPDVGGDAGVHEHIGGKLDDAVQPVGFPEYTAGCCWARCRHRR